MGNKMHAIKLNGQKVRAMNEYLSIELLFNYADSHMPMRQPSQGMVAPNSAMGSCTLTERVRG